MRKKNQALLSKWWSRFGSGEGGLWEKIICDRHYGGFEAWDVRDVKEWKCGGNWQNIATLRQLDEIARNVIIKGFKKDIGDGSRVRFWHDHWIGEQTLLDKFPMLYSLFRNKDDKVQSVGEWVSGVWTCKLAWRREFRGWEMELYNNLMNMLGTTSLCIGQRDNWRWIYGSDGCYTVCRASDALVNQNSIIGRELCSMIWNRFVPEKVSIFGWRLILGRLPTTMTLRHRGVNGGNKIVCLLQPT